MHPGHFDPTRATDEQKRQLSEAWATLAKLTRRLDGDTDEAQQQLRAAAELDPKNEALAQELAFQQRRERNIQLRLETAGRAEGGTRASRPWAAMGSSERFANNRKADAATYTNEKSNDQHC